MTVASGSDPARDPLPGTGGPEAMMRALAGFQEAAQAAVTHWGEDFTIQQGLNITWMLGNIIRDLRIATGLLGNFTVTSLTEAGPRAPGNAPGNKVTEPGHRVPGTLHRQAGHPTPNGEISEAARCLGAAADRARALPLPGAPARSANQAQGASPGGDPHRDGPAVAAAHDMRDALGVAAGTWTRPSGSDEDRDKIATEILFAVDRLEAATLVLAQGGPPRVREALRQVARDLDSSCIHLRESVTCSLTGGYQPGTGDFARQLRGAFPVLSEAAPTASAEAGGPGGEAPGLAATAFPHVAGTAATVVGKQFREHGAVGSPSQPRRPDSRRRKP